MGTTASGNEFSAEIAESFDPLTRGYGFGSADPAAKYTLYRIKVRYVDMKGLFQGAEAIWAGVNGNERVNGKARQLATATSLARVGPDTFEGLLQIPLKGQPGVYREDVDAVAFSFAELGANNSLITAKYDGAQYQSYEVPMRLTGPG